MAKVEFSYTGYQQPDWAAEPLTADKLVPGGAKVTASAFARMDAVTVTLAAGAVTAGSNKTLTFTAGLTGAIPSGAILDFGAGEFVTFPTGAAKGATSVTNATVAADLEGGESATYPGTSPIRKLESGTLVGRTFTERDAGTAYGVADTTTPDDQLFLVAFENTDLENNNEVTLVRHQTLIYEDKLPGWSSLTTGTKTAIRARYQCIKSAG